MASKAKRSPARSSSKAGASSAPDSAVASRRERAASETTRAQRRREVADGPSPAWLAPTAVTLLIVGILYMVVYYISSAQYPLPIGDWNLAAGIGIILVGGALMTGWK